MDFYAESLKLHANAKGKIAVTSKVPLNTRDDLSKAYTPGVAAPCKAIAANPDEVYTYTAKGNTVAIFSDGSAVLGLGNIGASAGIPVMEGKAILFKQFGGIDAFPICVDTQDTEEIIETAKRIAPVFGGINLEDISAPRCFEIEQRLEDMLDIPVFHDDQHGTAIAVSAALLNALKVVGKTMSQVRIVLNGPGAAGTAIIRMLLALGAKDVIAVDRTGTIYQGRDGLSGYKLDLARDTNPRKIQGNLEDALMGADVFIGVSVAGACKASWISSMAKDPIIFAMANPIPEIMPDEAKSAGAAVVGTGRSDFPNQINNVLVFPGLFRGALDVRARRVNYDMKIAAAHAIADMITPQELSADYIIPAALDSRVGKVVAEAVAKAARESGVAQI